MRIHIYTFLHTNFFLYIGIAYFLKYFKILLKNNELEYRRNN